MKNITINKEEEQFHYYMSEVGNTVSSTIPIVLYEFGELILV